MAESDQTQIRAIAVKLVFPTQLWAQLRATADDRIETAGIALANCVVRENRAHALVHEIRIANSEDYEVRGPTEAILTPMFVASVVAAARSENATVILFHSHPGPIRPEFSPADDVGEKPLREFLARRIPGRQHLALVIGATGQSARILGTEMRVPIAIVGSDVKFFDPGATSSEGSTSSSFDRQVRALGPLAQERLGRLRIGVVGLGGTGSLAVEQLAHLGVVDFLLIDPDTVEKTNLNRLVGATSSDIGKPKVDVAANLIQRVRPSARITGLRRSVLENDVLYEMGLLDAVFCCTDSHGSRYVLNELAYRFLIPCFDCGVAIATKNGNITHISARVQMLSPSLSCLNCTQILDSEQVRRDLLTEFQRAQDPYIAGAAVPEPAVISLNATAVSLAITMFLGAFCEFSATARSQRYDGIRGTVRLIDTRSIPRCITCAPTAAIAVGDAWPLPGRSK